MLFPTLLVCLFIICLPPLKWSLLTRAGRRRTIPAFPGTGHLMLRESASTWIVVVEIADVIHTEDV